jgi:hypothetical protein
MEAATRALGLALHPVSTRDPEEIDGAFAAMSRACAQGPSSLRTRCFDSTRVGARIRSLAAKVRLPALYGVRTTGTGAPPDTWTGSSVDQVVE